MMKKIGFVIPWYADSIPGGAEMELREVTSHLHAAGMNIEILTTCVKEFGADWSVNYYPEGEDKAASGVTIRRFKVRKRDTAAFDAVNAKLMSRTPVTPEEEDIFLREMVNSPDLCEYMQSRGDEYSLFVFIPYMFGTTYNGVKTAPERSVLIPCFHDEAYAYLSRFRELFPKAAGMIFNAQPESDLAERLYGFSQSGTKTITMGIGMDTDITADPTAFRSKFGIEGEYLIYVGRIDEGKNCPMMFRYFEEYKKRDPQSGLKLVLMGKPVCDIPKHKDIISLGFVSEEDKFSGISGAKALILPSRFESLSISVLEAMSLYVPVIVNGECEVLKGHCIKSNGGLYYNSYFEFEGIVNYIFSHDAEYAAMRENARKYIDDNYRWEVIMKNFRELIDSLCEE